MSRYEIVHNRRPADVLLVTDSLDEACWFVQYHHVRPPYRPHASVFEPISKKGWEAPPFLAPDVGMPETRWYAESVPGELHNCFVLLRDGHPVLLPDDEVRVRARRWLEGVLVPLWHGHGGRGRRPPATRWGRRGNAYRHTTRLDDERDDERPRIRPGARTSDPWDARDCPIKMSKSWKDQSKRRHQWRPVDMTKMGSGASPML